MSETLTKMSPETKARKNKIVNKIRKSYSPDWEFSPDAAHVAEKVNELYGTIKGCKTYYERRDILYIMARNALEQFANGGVDAGRNTLGILDELVAHLDEREIGGLIGHPGNGRIASRNLRK